MKSKTIWIWIGVVTAAVVVSLGIAIPLALRKDSDLFVGRMVLDEVPLVDGHNDLPYNFYLHENNQINDFDLNQDLSQDPKWGSIPTSFTDIPRLREGKVGGAFWVAYADCFESQHKDSVELTLDQIDVIKRVVDKYQEYMKFTTTADGIWEAFREGKIASLMGVEGGHSIDSRLSILRLYYELGVRYMTLTHNCNNPWADASPIDDEEEAVKLNLSEWGIHLIKEMNRLGMMIDLSHVSNGVMAAALLESEAPVIFSHSNSYTMFNHHRNVKDDILLSLADRNGIIMVNFYPDFIGGNSIDDVIKHLNYIKDLIGPDFIGIGSDYDGVSSMPVGLEDVSKLPQLFDRLAEEGHGFEPWTEEELKKLAGLNLIRVMKAVEEVSSEMKSRGIKPSEIHIPDEDLYVSANQTCRTDFEYTPEGGGVFLTRRYDDAGFEKDGC